MRETQRAQVSQQTYRGVCGLKSPFQDCGRRLDKSEFPFPPMAEIPFPVQCKKKRDLSGLAGKVNGYKNFKRQTLINLEPRLLQGLFCFFNGGSKSKAAR